jgi:hypothetical protein
VYSPYGDFLYPFNIPIVGCGLFGCAGGNVHLTFTLFSYLFALLIGLFFFIFWFIVPIKNVLYS